MKNTASKSFSSFCNIELFIFVICLYNFQSSFDIEIIKNMQFKKIRIIEVIDRIMKPLQFHLANLNIELTPTPTPIKGLNYN